MINRLAERNSFKPIIIDLNDGVLLYIFWFVK